MACDCPRYPLIQLSEEEFDAELAEMPERFRTVIAYPYMFAVGNSCRKIWPLPEPNVVLRFPDGSAKKAYFQICQNREECRG